VTPERGGGARRTPERELVAIVADYLERQGFRVYVDPDGTDYFDLVARRGEEVGLVEAKVADRRTVLAQALRRRAWGDWGAVALGSARAAERLAADTDTGRAAGVGVWSVAGGDVRVVRPARPWTAPGALDPFVSLRARFRGVLDAIDRGDLPAGVRWDGLLREVRRASGGRGFGEWRLDEPAADEP
jgi:hypothetical protein